MNTATLTSTLRKQALANVAQNEWLARLVRDYRDLAARWATWDEAGLRALVPPPEIRSWNYANTYGCPLHGGSRAVYEYSLDHPGQARCRIGGEVYPNPDFPDPDGRGWLDGRPGSLTPGQRYPFVADYYRFVWLELREACFALALEHLLSGDPRPARQAATILAAIGEVYPRTDNRCTEAWAPPSWWVPVTEHIMEGFLLRALANAYIYIKGSGQVREDEKQTIENGLLRHAAQVMRRVHHDHPTLQLHNTAAFLLQGISACARALADEELLHYVAGAMDFLLSNAVWEGGFWNEGSIGYHAEVTRALTFVAEALRPQVDLYKHPRFRQMIDLLFDVRSLETGEGLALGDTLHSTQQSAFFAPIARSEWGDGRYVLGADAFGPPPPGSIGISPYTHHVLGYRDAIALFLTRPLRAVFGRGEESPVGWRRYGTTANLSVLRERLRGEGPPAGWLEAMLYYGPFCISQTHGHADKLSLAMFGQGRGWLEEIGLTDGYLIPVYVGWSQHNLSHATVTVDARKQEPFPGGRLYLSHLSEHIKVADASAEDAYPERVSLYRRCLSLVRDPVDNTAYLFDLFRVRGGTRHEYSLHASDATFRAEGLALGEPQPGTLAGSDVPYGDPQGFDLRPGQIMGYRGSGYQVLSQPAYAAGEKPWRAFWQQGDKGLLVAMPGGAGETVIVADGQRFQLQENGPQDRFQYLLVRREAEKELRSDFVVALEVFQGQPRVEGVRLLPLEEGGEDAVAAAVMRGEAEDWFIHNLRPSAAVRTDELEVRGGYAYLCLRRGEPEYMMLLGGSHLAFGGYVLETEAGYEGEVARVEERTRTLILRGVTLPGGVALVGQRIYVERSEGGGVDYEIEAV
ncbi:MAG: heparinase II/III family protein, partial [Anaerolineae bacterium]|nr:heparinase II/III family protein [Anaerolineae bacterium]